MIILFNRADIGVFSANQMLRQRPLSSVEATLRGEATHFGIVNWSGISDITIAGEDYSLPTNSERGAYFAPLTTPLRAGAAQVGAAQVGAAQVGAAQVGALFLGVVFSALKAGKVEDRKLSTTNQVKSTLAGRNFISAVGVPYMEYSAQIPPLLDGELADSLFSLVRENRDANVIVQFENAEFGGKKQTVYGALSADTLNTQGYLRYGTKIKLTERY